MPKIIDHDERRREIVEVAKRIILKGGFEAATMREIADQAGFANGALKHYFPGKDSIVAATFESILDELDGAIAADETDDAGERLWAFLGRPLPSSTDEIAAGRVLLALWEYAMSNEELAELYRSHLSSWKANVVDRLAAARAAGAIAADPPYGPIADEYISVVIGAAVVNLMSPEGQRLGDYATYLSRLRERLVTSSTVGSSLV